MMRLWCGIALAMLLASCATGEGDAPLGDAQQRIEARLALANAYYADGKYAIALQEAARALEIAPRNADALALRGLAQWRLGDVAQAVDSMRLAMRADPDNPALQNNLGWMLCESGKGAEGLAYLDSALAQRRYAAPANAAMNAGHCSLRAGDRARAEAYFRRALAAEPALVPAQAQLARLSVARGDYASARVPMLAVVSSGQAGPEDYDIAVRIEQKLGDHAAEQSLVSQWQRRFPDSPQLRTYQRGRTDDQ